MKFSPLLSLVCLPFWTLALAPNGGFYYKLQASDYGHHATDEDLLYEVRYTKDQQILGYTDDYDLTRGGTHSLTIYYGTEEARTFAAAGLDGQYVYVRSDKSLGIAPLAADASDGLQQGRKLTNLIPTFAVEHGNGQDDFYVCEDNGKIFTEEPDSCTSTHKISVTVIPVPPPPLPTEHITNWEYGSESY